MVKFSRGDPNLEVITDFIRERGTVDVLQNIDTSDPVEINASLPPDGRSGQRDRLLPKSPKADFTETNEELQAIRTLEELVNLLQSLESTYMRPFVHFYVPEGC